MLASEASAGHVMSTDCWVPLSEWLILEVWGENWNPAVLTRSKGMLMRDHRPYWAIMRDWREENRRGRKQGGEMQESNAEWGRGVVCEPVTALAPWEDRQHIHPWPPLQACSAEVKQWTLTDLLSWLTPPLPQPWLRNWLSPGQWEVSESHRVSAASRKVTLWVPLFFSPSSCPYRDLSQEMQ